MTKEEILALLLAKFPQARKDGLTQLARIIALQVATKEEAAAAVEKLNAETVGSFIKEFRQDIDKEMSESNKTFEANLRKKFNFVEKNEEHEDQKDMAAQIAKAVADALKPVQEKLLKFEESNVQTTRLQRLNEKLTGCKDDNFKAQTLKDYARMKFDSDAEFDEYLNDKATDIEKANQTAADVQMRGGGSPLFTNKEKDGVSSGVQEFINSQKPEASKLSGKEL